MTLQKIAEFTKADAELNRRLREFQENVWTELGELTEEGRVLIVTTTGTLVRCGDLAIVAPGLTLELVLTEARSGRDDGRTLEVIKQTAGGTVTVRPAAGQVNGAATQSLTSVGLYRYKAARGSYWRHP